VTKIHLNYPRDGGPLACNCPVGSDHDADEGPAAGEPVAAPEPGRERPTPRHPILRQPGLNAEADETHRTVNLYFGESLVAVWPVDGGMWKDMCGGDRNYAPLRWCVDQFVARKLAALLDDVDRLVEEDER